MKYSVQVIGSDATVKEDPQGRYTSINLAIKAIIRAAKDTELTTVQVHGNRYSIVDEFTGGLLRDSQIILLTTGVNERDPSLVTRLLTALSEAFSTWLASRLHHRIHQARTKPDYQCNQILDATLKGPFDARLEALSYRSIKRRTHK